jgi:hypothetical protein
MNTITATCENETLALSYDYNLWPTCVPYLECKVPPLDPEAMKFDWKNSTGLAPGIRIK